MTTGTSPAPAGSPPRQDMRPLRRCGAVTQPDGSTVWRLWAPFARQVELVLHGQGQPRVVPTGPDPEGYFVYIGQAISPGQRYTFRLDGGQDRPDPCSLWQPDDVTGPSAIYDPARFDWTDAGWRGLSPEMLAIYELHVGTFTPAGTFEAVIPRLPELRDLGITAIELLPVNQFPGAHNWGYDGVLPYAAQHSYGGPMGLQRLVDAAHAAGVGVILDVVYNHFGPEGNYLHEFGPYFTDKYKTPWGKAVNFDDKGSDAVRDFVLDNARMWLEEFHLDGLRLDAVHAIYDLGARHILRAIQETADEVSQRTARRRVVIGESDLNDPRIILPPERGGHGLDGQWSDDFHHSVHALLTGERRGYYQDYGAAGQVAKVFDDPFLFAWDYSPHRGRKHGAPLPEGIGGERFVVCIQNHDQVGNRAIGDRLTTLLDNRAKLRLGASLLLLSPYVPLLFMGEEYGEERPFPFFCSFRGAELIQAVREGRRREFADFVDRPEDIPDPADEATFRSAQLTWAWPDASWHAGLRRLYQDLLRARMEWPGLRDFQRRGARLLPDRRGVIELVRGDPSGSDGQLLALFNTTEQPQHLPADVVAARTMLFSSEAQRYGGERRSEDDANLLPFEAIAFGPAAWRR